ncbi:hypothetical protein ASZ90_017096 [hydrocarbon metagenome]|uniref:SLH domain-containing protein n=1 Tax=hydrocarbon metagenome TaxID=938273 RepID=A0A0W8E9S6_9ZZZZ
MKRFTAIVITIAFMAVLLGPLPIVAADKNHWAQIYVDQLESRYPINETIGDYNLNDYISLDGMNNLLKCTMNSEAELSSTSRQEVVSKMVDIFSARTGINLDEVLFVALVPFEDFEQINPQYTRNIMYAYSSGLLKGRGNNLMHPADSLTYAEAFVLINRLESMVAADAFYVEGEVVKQQSSIKFNFKLVNRSGLDQDLTFASSQIYEVVVTDRTGQEVYRYSENMMFAQVVSGKIFKAGESIPGQLVWDMKDKAGVLLPAGRYNVQITFIPMESRDPNNSSLSTILSFNI